MTDSPTPRGSPPRDGSRVGEVKTIAAEVCVECRVHWPVDAEQPPCTAPDHSRRRIDLHLHHDEVVLPDRTVITAVSFLSEDPYRRDHVPDFGLYLDPAWQPPWPHDHLDWPDFGVPARRETVVAALTALHARAAAGDRVELGCLGGHGRTGTALALLGVLGGVPGDEAVDWVRQAYCPQAIETPAQAAFVTAPPGSTGTPFRD